MVHLDLFSGIGGFAYAADQVFGDVEHIFCDNNKFCQQVLNKHWPESRCYEDIRDIKKELADIVTGGFPTGWTDLSHSATPLSPKSQLK